MLLVTEIEIVQDYIGWWTNLDVLFLVCEVIVKVGVDLHGDLLIQAHWNIDGADDG